MPIFEREMLMARAMGRALAHELGHYFLASKEHTQERADESALGPPWNSSVRTSGRSSSTERSEA